MTSHLDISTFRQSADWRKNRKLARSGHKGLLYLPTGRTSWNATLAAQAFSVRRQLAGEADLNLWAAMHGCPPSSRYEQLGSDGLVLWHGTSAERAAKIRTHGLAHKRGVWAATEPSIAHSFTRGRSRAFRAGSAMIVLVISKETWDRKATRETDQIARLHQAVPPDQIEYILTDSQVEFVGDAPAKTPKPWACARFHRRGGKWHPQSRPPVRFDAQRSYSNLDEWLELSIRRIMALLGEAAAVEIFSSLYATVRPTEALEHKQIFRAIDRMCGKSNLTRSGLRIFALTLSSG